jgi:hypothetical protein
VGKLFALFFVLENKNNILKYIRCINKIYYPSLTSKLKIKIVYS